MSDNHAKDTYGALWLVTGGAGFIGSHLAEALAGKGVRVRVLDDLSTGRRENIAHLGDRVELIEASILDPDAVREAMEGVAYTLHLAARPSVPRSVAEPLVCHEINATGTVNVLQAAREMGVRRVVMASSSSVYGNQEGATKSEDMTLSPLSPYAASKAAAEHYMRAWHEVYGLETVVLRYFNVFGPRQDPNSAYAAVIPRFISTIMRGERPTIYGDGEQTRDFTYVANVVEANLLACAAPQAAGRVYNVAAGGSTTVNAIYRMLSDALGADTEPEYVPPRPGEVRHSRAEVGAARRDLGYEPRITVEEGVRRVVEYFQGKG